MAELSFDATQVEVQDSFELLSAGWYPAMITQSEWKVTNAGTGKYLKLRLDIIEGHGQGRVLFDNLNLQNPNPQAVEIAQKTLASICYATNVLRPKDTVELHDKPLLIKVGIKPARDGYEAQNEIKGYKPLETSSPQPQQHTQQPQQTQQQEDLGPAFPSEATGMDEVPF